MSKIMQAVKGAETERLSYVETLKQELREELKWMGSVMARWDPAGVAPSNGGDAMAAPVAASPSWEQVMVLVRQRLEHAAQAAAALETARQALNVQVDAARTCQALAQDLAVAVQEFQANAAAIDRLVQSAPPSADAVASYQQLADALQQCVSQFTSRLSRAVAPQ